MGQGFEQGVADALRQLQGFAVQASRTPQVGIDNGQVGQGRQAHQPLAVTPLRQAFQRFAAIALSQFTIAPTTGDDPAQRQPLGQHRLLRSGRRRRQETTEVAGQFFRRIQLAGQAQGPAVEHDQARRADQQAVGQVHFPAQQHAHVLLGQQLLFRQVLYQVGRHIQVTGAQRLLHRLVDQPLGIEPATRAQVQAGRRQHVAAGTPRAQQVRKKMVITVPMPLLVKRHQEYLVRLQVTQDFGTVVGFTHRIAEFAAKSVLRGGVVQKRLHFGRQAVDDLFQQVIADQPFAAVQALRQGAVAAGLGGGQ